METLGSETVFADTFTPDVNIGNTAENAFSGSTPMAFSVDVVQQGFYRVSFYTADAPWADLVVGRATLRRKGDVSLVSSLTSSQPVRVQHYNLAGQPVRRADHGFFIEKTIMQDGTALSRVVRK